MNLSHHAPPSLSDPEWIDQAIEKMGEDSFWQYVDKIYTLFEKLDVGQSLPIEEWCNPINYGLFIKIATCFVSESKCCYQFNPEYTIIKRNFDAREMEKTLALLRLTRGTKIIEGDGGGNESPSGGVETIFTPLPALQNQ